LFTREQVLRSGAEFFITPPANQEVQEVLFIEVRIGDKFSAFISIKKSPEKK
jgi:hypothetical protein